MTVPEEMTLFGSLPCGAGCGKGTPGAGDGAAEAECLRSGPFTLRRYAQGRTSALSSRGYVLLFCLRGSVELRLRSFSYRLTPAALQRLIAAVWRSAAAGRMPNCWNIVPEWGASHPAVVAMNFRPLRCCPLGRV